VRQALADSVRTGAGRAGQPSGRGREIEASLRPARVERAHGTPGKPLGRCRVHGEESNTAFRPGRDQDEVGLAAVQDERKRSRQQPASAIAHGADRPAIAAWRLLVGHRG
jgi:hypothetical protein